jgi:hypothetical protein
MYIHRKATDPTFGNLLYENVIEFKQDGDVNVVKAGVLKINNEEVATKKYADTTFACIGLEASVSQLPTVSSDHGSRSTTIEGVNYATTSELSLNATATSPGDTNTTVGGITRHQPERWGVRFQGNKETKKKDTFKSSTLAHLDRHFRTDTFHSTLLETARNYPLNPLNDNDNEKTQVARQRGDDPSPPHHHTSERHACVYMLGAIRTHTTDIDWWYKA